MYRIRMVVKNEGTGKHEGLEKLMLKIGVFSSLYLVSHFSFCQLLVMNSVKPFKSKNRDKTDLDAPNPILKKGSDFWTTA